MVLASLRLLIDSTMSVSLVVDVPPGIWPPVFSVTERAVKTFVAWVAAVVPRFHIVVAA